MGVDLSANVQILFCQKDLSSVQVPFISFIVSVIILLFLLLFCSIIVVLIRRDQLNLRIP